MSHIDEQISLLTTCIEKFQAAASMASAAANDAAGAIADLVQIEQEMSEISGYTAMAINAIETPGVVRVSTARADAINTAQLLTTQLDNIVSACMAGAEDYRQIIARIQAAASQ